MRVISGKYKGKKLMGFCIDGTRPTMDRVKESLFGMIQNYVPDSVVLDLFAGSGALGIEAVSQGALKVFLVDNNLEVIKIIEKNVYGLSEEVKIVHSDYKRFLKSVGCVFDIIFLDPPYNSNCLNKAIKIIEERNLLRKGGIVVCELEFGEVATKYKKIKDKKYGKKRICIYECEK